MLSFILSWCSAILGMWEMFCPPSILDTYTAHFSLALMSKLQQGHSEDYVPSVTASLAVVHPHTPGDLALLYLSLKN